MTFSNNMKQQRGTDFKDAVFHLIYVNEEKEKSLENLQRNLKKLNEVGIKEGAVSIGQGYRETLDSVRHEMFPRQTLTEVDFIISFKINCTN